MLTGMQSRVPCDCGQWDQRNHWGLHQRECDACSKVLLNEGNIYLLAKFLPFGGNRSTGSDVDDSLQYGK